MKRLLTTIAVSTLILGMVAAAAAEPKIVGKTVDYSAQGAVMKGYLAYDENIRDRRPECSWFLNGGGLMIMLVSGQRCWRS